MKCAENIANNHKAGFFLPRDVLRVFGTSFFDEHACRYWMLQKIHGNQAFCPGCNTEITDIRKRSKFYSGGRLRCYVCGKHFTALTGTFLNGTHMGFKDLILLSVLLGLGLEVKKIADILGRNPETVRLWKHKFDALETIEGIKNEENQDCL